MLRPGWLRFRWFAAIAISFGLAAAPAWAVRVDYSIAIRPGDGPIRVTAVVRDDPDSTVTLAMPVWLPGYYRRTDQWRGVSNVRFTAGNVPLTVRHPGSSTWCVAHVPYEPLTATYDVAPAEYGYDAGTTDQTLGQMGVYVDRNAAFVHPGAACMYVEGHQEAPATLALNLPSGWDAALPLPKNRDGIYRAADYDELNDSPIQTGRFRRIAFTTRGHACEIIITGRPRVSDRNLLAVCKVAAAGTNDYFQGWAPFTTYQFHFHFPPGRTRVATGLEHRASTVIVFRGNTSNAEFLDDGAHLVCHEFLHAWNVKALRPAGLGPFDYQREVRTPSLWLAEGITDYIAHLVGARAKLWTPDDVLKRFSVIVASYRASDGWKKTSLADSSIRVWDAVDASSSGYGGTDYYIKGLLAGWLLDVQIRSTTRNAHSLDDALQWLIRRYAVTGRAYGPDALLEAIREATEVDLSADYREFIYGVSDLPIERVAALAGIMVRTEKTPYLTLGVEMTPHSSEALVMAVHPGSAAAKAGIAPGDVLLAIDGERIQIGGRPLLAGKSRSAGDRVPVLLRRAGQDITVAVIVQEHVTVTMRRDPDAGPAQKAVWDGLFAPRRPTPAASGSPTTQR